jgi:hypothetical protein
MLRIAAAERNIEMKSKFLQLNFRSPKAEERCRIVEAYATKWLADQCDFYDSLDDYCRQAKLDTGDKMIGLDIKRAVKRLERTGAFV